MITLDRGRRAPAFMVRVSKISARAWIHCNFFTKPKINLTVQRPKTLHDGYPLKPKTLGERIKKKSMTWGCTKGMLLELSVFRTIPLLTGRRVGLSRVGRTREK